MMDVPDHAEGDPLPSVADVLPANHRAELVLLLMPAQPARDGGPLPMVVRQDFELMDQPAAVRVQIRPGTSRADVLLILAEVTGWVAREWDLLCAAPMRPATAERLAARPSAVGHVAEQPLPVVRG